MTLSADGGPGSTGMEFAGSTSAASCGTAPPGSFGLFLFPMVGVTLDDLDPARGGPPLFFAKLSIAQHGTSWQWSHCSS